MSDKFQQTISVVPTFVNGESPPANKFNVGGSQLQRGLGQLEYVVGDVWGRSWPYHATVTSWLTPTWGRQYASNTVVTGGTDRALDIVNLARLIGPASNMNPKMIGTSTVQDPSVAGKRDFCLKYVPVDPTTIDAGGTTEAALVTYRATPQLLTATGHYHCTAEGRVYTFDATTGGVIEYSTNPATYAGGMNPQGAAFNVMPDPAQIAAGGSACAVTGTGPYTVTLPVISHQQRDITGTTAALSDADVNDGLQLYLPQVILDNFVGAAIPDGFLYVKDETTGEVYTSGSYTYVSSSAVSVSGVSLNTGNDHSIITVGNDITTAIDDLRDKSFHTHDRTFGEPMIPLDSIYGFVQTAEYYASNMDDNFAPQYLHRDGYDAAESAANDGNCMRGELILGLAAGTPGTYLGSGETFGIGFGNISASRIYRDSGSDLRVFAGEGDLDLVSNNDDITLTVGSFGNKVHSTNGYIESGSGFTKGDVSASGSWSASAPVGTYAIKITGVTAPSSGSLPTVYTYPLSLTISAEEIYSYGVTVYDEDNDFQYDGNQYQYNFHPSLDHSGSPSDLSIYWPSGSAWNGENITIRLVVWCA